MFEDKDDVLHPDELHERYKDVLAENTAESTPYLLTSCVCSYIRILACW
jgi:hypothetical protein